jgi:hypothetical protein
MGAVIQFEQHTKWDHRAQHRIFSEPVALEITMNVDALAQEGMAYLEPAHLLALGHGDRELVRGITVAFEKFAAIRAEAQKATDLAQGSAPVEPWTLFGGGDAA